MIRRRNLMFKDHYEVRISLGLYLHSGGAATVFIYFEMVCGIPLIFVFIPSVLASISAAVL